ncbi:MAG: methyltransferase domain-containing protein [Leptospiraceae bacterium]|nr:methyltransferase domain-containing protein [Leptospiraceae bacterium]
MGYSDTVQTARTYYNSDDADRFYATVWGGEDIHIGLYNSPDESIFDASRRTVERMASYLKLGGGERILDIGAGYGGAARFLAAKYGSHVDCLNLSEVQNQRNRDMNKDQGLADKINVIDGSFESVPAEANTYDYIWSQDAILHSGNRETVIQEVARVMKPGGEFIMTDPMQSDDCPEGVLQPVLDRIHLDTMGSPEFYRGACERNGMEELHRELMTHQLVNHYSRVRAVLKSEYDQIVANVSKDYVDRMIAGLGHWVEAGEKGYLAWGILHYRKK